MFIYFWDRQRQSASWGRAERQGDTEFKAGSRLWAVSTEPWCRAEIHEPWDHDLSWSQMSSWLSHPRHPNFKSFLKHAPYYYLRLFATLLLFLLLPAPKPHMISPPSPRMLSVVWEHRRTIQIGVFTDLLYKWSSTRTLFQKWFPPALPHCLKNTISSISTPRLGLLVKSRRNGACLGTEKWEGVFSQ